MHHNLFRRKLPVATLCIALVLAGCNRDGEGSNSGSTEPLVPTSISAQNATFVTDFVDRYQVDLSDKVSVSNNDSFTLIDVTSLSAAPECQPLEQSKQSFTITADSSKSCSYRYQVAVAGSNTTSKYTDDAITRIAVTTTGDISEVELPIISATTLVEEQVDVNVRTQLLLQGGYTVGDGFTLSDVVSLPYSENTASVDSANGTITYTPPAGFEGIERILFSYVNSTSGEVLLGTLDVAVAGRVNEGLTVQSDIEWPDIIETNVPATIDVAEYVDSPDGDKFQLIYVDSFNASTVPTNPIDMYNTEFTIETSKFGEHYVSFAVTDHNGAYAMGLMKVLVYDSNATALWKGISHQSLYFSGPLTSQEAVGQGVEYKESLLDDSYTPAVSLALFDNNLAQRYCGTKGRLPDVEELKDLGETYVSDGGVHSQFNWPDSKQYIASSNGGGAKLVDLNNGAISDYMGGAYLATCIEGGLKVQAVNEDIIANGVDVAPVIFTLSGEDEDPIGGSVITVSVDDVETTSVVTDIEGKATANITSNVAKDLTICGEIGLQKTCTMVRFVGDPATAEITKATLDVSNWSNGSSDSYPIYATVEDANNNPVKGALVTFSVTEDLNDSESVQLLTNSALTNENGIASVNVTNSETTSIGSDFSRILVGHTNSNDDYSSYVLETAWGAWQWAEPLEVRISAKTIMRDDFQDVTDYLCSSEFGEDYRLLTTDEISEYQYALKEQTPPLDSFEYQNDPIANAVVNASYNMNLPISCRSCSDTSETSNATLDSDTFVFYLGLRPLVVDQSRWEVEFSLDAEYFEKIGDFSMGNSRYAHYYNIGRITKMNSFPFLDDLSATYSSVIRSKTVCVKPM